MKKLVTLTAISMVGLLVSGCVPVLVGAAAAGAGGATYYKHNDISEFLRDGDIQKTAYRRIQNDASLSQGTHIVVVVNGGNVLVVGQVPNPSMKPQVSSIIKQIRGVRQVYNFLTISGPSSNLVRSSDSWITAKIKSELVLAKNVPADQIKVVTEDGVVYLMGSGIAPDAQNMSVSLARQIVGVQKVVKLFQ